MLFTFNILTAWAAATPSPAGLIYAMLHNYKAMDMINLPWPAALPSTHIHGDANITDDVSSICN